jgi:dipeptidyl aminopeptidase/acylaminoacyl peptidase
MFRSLPCALLLFTLQASAQPATPSLRRAASATHGAIPLDQAAADRYEGYYQVGPQRAVHFWREGNHFYFGAVGTPQRSEAIPEAPDKFSYANGVITFEFNAGADGRITGLTINQAGRRIVAPRIAETVAKGVPAPGTVVAPKRSVPHTWIVMHGLIPKALTGSTAGTLDYWPCFSPDGKTVLFSRSLDGGKNWGLFRVAAEGGTAELFAKLPVSATRASWSGKTGRIVFNGTTPDGKSAIWVIDGDGRNARVLATPGILVPSYPSWYPDGKTIGFSDAARNILYRMNIESGRPIAVTRQTRVLAGMSSVSPDGKWVAFAGQKSAGQVYNQGDNQIWLLNAHEASRTLEAHPLPGRTPSWSPNGKRLAFESDRGSPNGLYAVFIVNRDGGDLVQVTDYALNANHPVFSPDGRRVVFSMGNPASRMTNVAVVTLPGRAPSQR